MAEKKEKKSRSAVPASGTIIHVLLDMSSSMMDMWSETIDATNAFIEGLTAAAAPSYVTVTVFGGIRSPEGYSFGAKDIMKEAPAYELPKITAEQYRPSGGTPLYQAIQRAVATLAKTEAESKIIIVLTDGEDSSGNSPDDTKRALAEFKKAGGLFLFLGCKEAMRIGWERRLGFDKGHMLQFSSKKPVVAAKEAAMAALMFRSTGKAEFSDEARGRAA